jgi:hypothetical protein
VILDSSYITGYGEVVGFAGSVCTFAPTVFNGDSVPAPTLLIASILPTIGLSRTKLKGAALNVARGMVHVLVVTMLRTVPSQYDVSSEYEDVGL